MKNGDAQLITHYVKWATYEQPPKSFVINLVDFPLRCYFL
jgi:hypothetical protein